MTKKKSVFRITPKPEGHTLYWIYVYVDKTGEYNFETTTNFAQAKKLAREMINKTDHWDYAYIWYGDEDGAFTYMDYADYYTRKA